MPSKNSDDTSKKIVNKNDDLLEQEKKKNILLKFLVIILTLVIFSAWVLNLKNSWQFKKNNQSASPIVTEIKQNVDETVEEISQKVKKLEEDLLLEQGTQDFINDLKKEFNAEFNNESELSEPDFSNSQEPNDNQEQNNNQEPNDGREPNDGSVIPRPSPVIPMENGCPAWINCMPTFDGPAPDCVIPPGCEDYTQLVY